MIVGNEHHKEKLSDIANMLSKKLGEEVVEKEALKLVRKAYPSVFYRKRNTVGLLSGIEIKEEFRPRDLWIEKSIIW